MTTSLTVYSLLSTLVILSSGAVLDQFGTANNADSANSLADTGNSLVLGHIVNTSAEGVRTSTNNTANSVTGTARSGNALFFGGGDGGVIQKSDFELINSALYNQANNTNGTAKSGNQNVINNIKQNSNVILDNFSQGNKAYADGVTTPGGDVDKISGVQNQVQKSIDSNLSFGNSAISNTAKNIFGGDSVAGISNNAQIVHTSDILFDDFAISNYAINEDGKSIAGSESNVEKATNTNITLLSNSYTNNANSSNGDAIAGNQNNFQVLEQYTTLTVNNEAANNNAYATNGSAVGGSQTNANYLSSVNFGLDADVSSNYAKIEGSQIKTATAGVDVNFATVINSSITIDALAEDNSAVSEDAHSGSDAISGFDVILGDASNNIVNVNATSSNNIATAVNGDAIAGNRVQVLGDDNAISLYLDAYDNYAMSQNGDAVAGNYVQVQGKNNNVLKQYLTATGNTAKADNGVATINSNLVVAP